MENIDIIHAEKAMQMNEIPYAKALSESLNLINKGEVNKAFTAFGKGSVDYFSKAGWETEDMADSLAMLMEEGARLEAYNNRQSTFRPTRPYSMIATQKSATEIREIITLMNNYLMCSELIFCDLEQKYACNILDLLKEKGLYRHKMKMHANKLREQTDLLQIRLRDNDRMSAQRSSGLIMPSKRYANAMFEEVGGIASKLQITFLRMFDKRLKLIRMDSREIAKKLNLKHPDLIAEIFTLLALTETSIEIFTFCQQQIRMAGRGRLIDHTIKSTHHESVRNAAKGLLDQFVDRNTEMPDEEATRARKHVAEFHKELVKDEMFEMFNAQYMALRIDYIEFYLASVRLEIEQGTVSRGLIREVWHRLGTRQATKSFFNQLAKVPIPDDEDTNTTDVACAISGWNGQIKTVDRFRRLCVEGTYEKGIEETEEQVQYRILRTVARTFKGHLPNHVLASLVRAHGTKKAVVEQLRNAGFELKPTLDRVKKMRASELKQIA